MRVVLAPTGEETTIPAPLESIFPNPGDTVVRQTIIEVDLPVGYTIELYVDGIWIPPDEIGFDRPRPAASSGSHPRAERWRCGREASTPCAVVWDRTAGGRPDPGEFTWVFRVQ